MWCSLIVTNRLTTKFCTMHFLSELEQDNLTKQGSFDNFVTILSLTLSRWHSDSTVLKYSASNSLTTPIKASKTCRAVMSSFMSARQVVSFQVCSHPVNTVLKVFRAKTHDHLSYSTKLTTNSSIMFLALRIQTMKPTKAVFHTLCVSRTPLLSLRPTMYDSASFIVCAHFSAFALLIGAFDRLPRGFREFNKSKI